MQAVTPTPRAPIVTRSRREWSRRLPALRAASGPSTSSDPRCPHVLGDSVSGLRLFSAAVAAVALKRDARGDPRARRACRKRPRTTRSSPSACSAACTRSTSSTSWTRRRVEIVGHVVAVVAARVVAVISGRQQQFSVPARARPPVAPGRRRDAAVSGRRRPDRRLQQNSPCRWPTNASASARGRRVHPWRRACPPLGTRRLERADRRLAVRRRAT